MTDLLSFYVNLMTCGLIHPTGHIHIRLFCLCICALLFPGKHSRHTHHAQHDHDEHRRPHSRIKIHILLSPYFFLRINRYINTPPSGPLFPSGRLSRNCFFSTIPFGWPLPYPVHRQKTLYECTTRSQNYDDTVPHRFPSSEAAPRASLLLQSHPLSIPGSSVHSGS